MNKISSSQALGMWAITAIVLFFIASLFSWTFSEWHWFSKLIFWAPTIILGVWTINDYFIKPKK